MAGDAAQNVVRLYRKHARTWAQTRAQRFAERSWLDRFVGLMPDKGTVLDVGCGAGRPMACYMAAQGLRVTGVDAAPEMVAQFAQNVPEATSMIADMRALALAKQFNGVLAWDSFFHLEPADQRKMFAVFKQHAAPDACLLFNTGDKHGEAIGTLEGAALYHASLDAQGYRTLLDAHGFEVLRHVENDASCGGRTVWLAKRTQKRSRPP